MDFKSGFRKWDEFGDQQLQSRFHMTFSWVYQNKCAIFDSQQGLIKKMIQCKW